jgi:putative ABC transport system ATP-binding protein
MISLNNISVILNDRTILHSISGTINTGELITIVGPNGAGKTTLFDIITGKLQPTTGTITFDGKDITHLNEQQRAPFISRLFQNPSLNCVSTMTVVQNLAMATYKGRSCQLRSGMASFNETLLAPVLERLNITSKTILHQPMGALSGGQRQLVSFLMATLIPPSLLLLDEPTAALDPAAATTLITFALEQIKTHRMTTIIITHDPQLAITIADMVWVLDNGTIVKKIGRSQLQTTQAQELIAHLDYEKIAASAAK